MAEWIILIAVVALAPLVVFGSVLVDVAEDVVYRLRNRRRRKSDLELEHLARHQRTLKRIDELERELEIGKYSPVAKELDERMAEEEKAEEMAKRAKQHAELVEKLRSRGEDFPVTEATRLLGWFKDGKLDSTVWRPGVIRRDYNIETGETTDIRAFGT